MAQNYFGRGYRSSSPCIFISHSNKDKPIARAAARAIVSMSVDIYFDEMDDCLRRAGSDDVGVVSCINAGLDNSSHLLGVISQNTKGSWWVPYEIGGAMGQKKECAHLISRDVDAVPAYIKAGKVILDKYDLTNWIASIRGSSREALFETMRKSENYGGASGLDAVLPDFRSNMRYY
jgi:hypothetical protein